MDLFASVGLRPRIAQIAEEKQTIIKLVAAGIGSAIVPRWTSKLALSGVRYIPLKAPGDGPLEKLPLAAAWRKGERSGTGRDAGATRRQHPPIRVCCLNPAHVIRVAVRPERRPVRDHQERHR